MIKKQREEFFKKYNTANFCEFAGICADKINDLSLLMTSIYLKQITGCVNKSELKRARLLSVEIDKLNRCFRHESVAYIKTLVKKEKN